MCSNVVTASFACSHPLTNTGMLHKRVRRQPAWFGITQSEHSVRQLKRDQMCGVQ